jgi:nucleotide-binding universal stress UspA family protein
MRNQHFTLFSNLIWYNLKWKPSNQLREQMKQYLIGVRSELRAEDITVRCQLIEVPSVAHLICDYGNSEGVDMVVMSTHGRGGISEFLFGSIADRVMHSVKVPVLLIQPDKN